MGMFKSIKDMRTMVHATPGLIDQANQMTANAHAMQQACAQAQVQQYPTAAMSSSAPAEVFAPIAGVDLAMFARISAGLAQYGYDQNMAVGLAAAQGIDSTSWQAALDGWNQRIASTPQVAVQFNALYTGRG